MRLPQFNHLPEAAQKALEIPDYAEDLKVTTTSKGAIIVSYVHRGTDEERKKNRNDIIQTVSNMAFAVQRTASELN